MADAAGYFLYTSGAEHGSLPSWQLIWFHRHGNKPKKSLKNGRRKFVDRFNFVSPADHPQEKLE
jgi:hypothetical protein